MIKTDWEPGMTTVLTDPRSIHRGKTVTLVERQIGLIAGRPWWTLRLASGALTSEFEDSLEGVTP